MKRMYVPPVLLLAVSLTSAQEINTAIGLGGPPSAITIFDEIEDPRERRAFREVWNTREPPKQRDLAIRFVERYPRSVLLKEAYELAARACVATADYAAGLDWAKRSLRLLPENPFLLVMVADVAAKQQQPELAETSAQDALRYLENADTPTPVSPRDWPRIRDELRATANFVLGHVAATREQYKDAEQLLMTALRLNPEMVDATYVLGVVRMAMQDDDSAAAAFARVMRGNGPLSGPARQSLHLLYERRTRDLRMSFDEYASSLQWTPPEPAPSTPAAPRAERYAGSAACRDCHPGAYDSWQETGMAKMLRPYRPEYIFGDFSGRQTVSGNARAIMADRKHFIEIRQGDSNRWHRYPVDYIIGSKWQQAYATKLPDSRVLVFPIQYSRLQSTWMNYWKIVDAPGTPRTDISRFHEIPEGAIYQNTCAACHTSQLSASARSASARPRRSSKSGVGAEAVGPADLGSATFREPGINCEMCHGPSLGHVEQMKGLRGDVPIGMRDSGLGIRFGSATATPVSFRRLPAAQYLTICAQCHAQSAIHDAQPTGAVNYSEDRAPFYRAYSAHLPSNFSRKAFYRDGRYRATTFISEAFARSQCFRKGGATCGSCHNPHPPNARENPNSLKFGEDADQMCLQCHTGLGDRPEQHTRHAPDTEASRCVSCHMPRIMDALLFPARSHEIDDVPDAAMTERFGNDQSPNACLACHRTRDATWLGYQLAKW